MGGCSCIPGQCDDMATEHRERAAADGPGYLNDPHIRGDGPDESLDNRCGLGAERVPSPLVHEVGNGGPARGASGIPSQGSADRPRSPHGRAHDLVADANGVPLVSPNSGSGGGMADRPRPSVLSDLAPQTKEKTLDLTGGNDKAAAERAAAYQARKEERRARKDRKGGMSGGKFGAGSLMDRDGFLSNVPEVEADVQYRFSFIVAGATAKKVVQSACESSAAMALPHADKDLATQGPATPAAGGPRSGMLGGDGPGLDGGANGESVDIAELELGPIVGKTPSLGSKGTPARSQGGESLGEVSSPTLGASVSQSRKSTPKAGGKKPGTHLTHRCLCPVPFPWGRAAASERLKLAKLVFQPLVSAQEIPITTSRLEATGSAVVFILVVDPGSDAEPFEEQLFTLTMAIKDIRLRMPVGLRPKRAVVLVREGQAPDPEALGEGEQEPWEESLEEFEKVHGALWKFGIPPIAMKDADGLHAAFAKIASERIAKTQNNEADSDGSKEDELDNLYEAERAERSERDEDGAEQARKSPIAKLGKAMARMAGRGGPGSPREDKDKKAPLKNDDAFPFEEWEHPDE